MAKYQILVEPYVASKPYGRYDVGEIVELPDDELPSEKWLALDPAAELAMAEQIRLNEAKGLLDQQLDDEGNPTGKELAIKRDRHRKPVMPMPRPPWDGPVKARNAAALTRMKERAKAALATQDDHTPVTMSQLQQLQSAKDNQLAAMKLGNLAAEKDNKKSKRAADQEPA